MPPRYRPPTVLQRQRQPLPRLALVLLLAALGLNACQPAPVVQGQTSPGATASPTPSPSLPLAPLPTLTPYPTSARAPLRPPPTPQYTPVTAVPPALAGVERPSEVRLLVLLGSGQESPFAGRTEAVMLVFYNPRLGMGSVLSVPPDLFVNIPGYTMQRLSTAYAVGGFRALSATLVYNLGVRPDEYALIQADTFDRVANELGGLQVSMAAAYPFQCGGLPAGTRELSAELARCYMSFREGSDELNRMHRQQDVLMAFFRRMVEGGNLVRVPGLYNALKGQVDTNLSLNDLSGAVPLLLRVADAGHLGLFQMGPETYREWRIPGALEPVVFLPEAGDVRRAVQQAIDFVTQGEPYSQQILTLEAALTASPFPTPTRTRVPPFLNVPTVEITPLFQPVTATPEGSGPQLTVTPVVTGTAGTPSPGVTPSPTLESYP